MTSNTTKNFSIISEILKQERNRKTKSQFIVNFPQKNIMLGIEWYTEVIKTEINFIYFKMKTKCT